VRIAMVDKIDVGMPRAVVHCAEEDLDAMHSLIPGLRAEGISCAVYKEQRGGSHRDKGRASPKAGQADRGLRDASGRAGVCHYMSAGKPCPHSQQGQCRFVCYEQKPSAQRGQPSGWRR
jgi:hypothetical protein